MPADHSRVTCEIRCAHPALAQALGQIAMACANDTGQPVDLRLLPLSTGKPVVTLSLPVELAAAQHPVWCLACRLACFCPEARVSVLILGEKSFAPASDRQACRRPA